jgi:Ca2+-binding EF-hand superfamily protein
VIERRERSDVLRQRFQRLDANDDGRVSRQEFADAYARYQARRTAPPPTGRLDEIE